MIPTTAGRTGLGARALHPSETREAMAEAVCADIERHGAHQVAALVVSHTDAEDLSDRIRTRLTETGLLRGWAMTGPGWTSEREYRAGDRVLLHARCGPSGTRLVNGTTATVTQLDTDGLTICLDSGAEAVLPAAFVAGARKDGSPNLSHSWARTVDGAQGGTWEACHLLGSSALDAYRGYTGQSRSRRPTHTWNTARVAVVDHGGILADQRDGAEQVADELARVPDPSLAARSDPWVVDRQLHGLIAEHEQVLAGRPPDRQDVPAAAAEEMSSARSQLADMEAAVARRAADLERLGSLAGLSRHRLEQRRLLHDRLEAASRQAGAARDRYEEIAGRVERIRREQDAYERFESAEGWRRGDLDRVRHQLDRHWAGVVAACVRADDPLAYGIGKLRHARSTLNDDRRAVEAGIPDDRGDQWQEARRQLPEVVGQRHQAEELLTDSRARLQDAGRRRWGRHDHEAVADAQAQVAAGEQGVDQAIIAERDLRERLAALAGHQRQRQQHIADISADRKQLDATVAQVDAALDRTRPDRLAALADDPPEHLVARIGSPPDTPAGRAVWCHHALGIEAAVDRNDGHSPAWTGWSPQTDRARHEIAVADRVLEARSDRPGTTEWVELAEQAGVALDQARRAERDRAARQRTAARRQQPHPTPWIDPAAERPGPGISS